MSKPASARRSGPREVPERCEGKAIRARSRSAPGYCRPRPAFREGTRECALRATERVLGYQKGETAVAYPLGTIARKKLIEDTIAGQNVVIFFEPGQVSALDNASIERSKEVGSASMYIPEVDGQQLTFVMDGNTMTDNETGSSWNIFGQAIAGPLAGSELQPMLSHTHFWFAWAAFRPDTTVYSG